MARSRSRTPEFGVQCQAAMLRLGMTQKEVADEIGVPRTRLSAVIKGKQFDVQVARKLKDYLGVVYPYDLSAIATQAEPEIDLAPPLL